MSELLKWTSPVARVAHVCDQCSRTIRVGEKYSRHESVGDYGFETSKTCVHCVSLGRDLYQVGERGEDDMGADCYPYLPDVDWDDVARWSTVWRIRADLYRARWTKDDGTLLVYPEESGMCPECHRTLTDPRVTCRRGRYAGWTCHSVTDAYQGRGA